jgi:hypothetical protein
MDSEDTGAPGTDVPDPNEPESPTENATEPGEEKPVSQINILPLFLADPDLTEWIEKEAEGDVRLVKDDVEGRKEYEERHANQLRLYAGIVPTLGAPAEGAKAPHIAIMAKALLHLWARTYDQVIPAKGDIVHSVPFGPQDMDRAQRTEQHLNWQLRHRVPDWASGHQANIMGWYMGGSTWRHYRYDPIEGVHRVDTLGIDDIIVPYSGRDDHPLMKSLPRITRVLKLARWEAEVYEDAGVWSNLEAVYPADDDVSTTNGPPAAARQGEETETEKAVIEISGVDKPIKGDKNAKRHYWEIQTYKRFPKKLGIPALEAIAGKTKPVVFTVDKITKKPLALTVREEPDPIDQSRFDNETKAFGIAAQNVASQQAMPPAPGAPTPTAPKPPKPVRQQTVYNIVHYRLFPNPDGILGLGVGSLLESSNELANVLAAEYMLGAKLENLKGGFIPRGSREKRGDISFTPGKFVEMDLEPEVMQKAIVPLTFSPPSEGLMKVVEKLEANSEIAANADILSGEKGSSNETAKGMMVRNSNALALISVMTRLYLEAMKYEIKMIAHGNAVQMDGSETFPVSSMTGADQSQVTNVTVNPADYVEDVHIEFTADARMSSKPERVSDAKDFLQSILNSPLAQNAGLVDFAFRFMFRSAEAPQFEAAMGPPPQPPPPPQPESQDTENAGFFNEQDHPVMPDDNHMEHLHKIEELQKSPLHQGMSSTGKQMLDRHKRGHLSQFYLQMQELQKATGTNVHAAAGMGGNAGGPGGGAVPPPGGGAPPGGGQEPAVPGPGPQLPS